MKSGVSNAARFGAMFVCGCIGMLASLVVAQPVMVTEPDTELALESDGAVAMEDLIALENAVALEATVAPDELYLPAPAVWTNELGTLVIYGDVDVLVELGLLDDLSEAFAEIASDRAAVRQTATRFLTDEIHPAGYSLAVLWADEDRSPEQPLKLFFDAGYTGRLDVSFIRDGETVEKGRWFSRHQIAERFKAVSPGVPFRYDSLYAAVFNANTHPDLTVDVVLDTTRTNHYGLDRRLLGVQVEVEERFPLHFILDMDNYGTEASGSWRATPTIQHLNLTKSDDVLTLSAPFALTEPETLYSIAGSYYHPAFYGRGGVTLYGGWSDLDAREVVESIDIKGKGGFVGLQTTYEVLSSVDHLLAVHAGIVGRRAETHLIVQDYSTDPREATIIPLSLAASYTSQTPDRLGGRNFATLQASGNFDGMPGVSDDAEMAAQRVGAKATYLIGHLQYARVQPLLGSETERGPEGQWVLFLKFEGQKASVPLIPLEKFGIGGGRSVRGYLERELLGDDGFYTNIELCTPLLLGGLDRLLSLGGSEISPVDRIQLVAFADTGYVSSIDPLPGEKTSHFLASVGTGLRLALGDNAQIKFDWGFPVEETIESGSSGRGNVNLQIQF